MNHIVMIGFMGAGKTTVGRRLARALDLTFTDTDDRIVERMQMPVTEIFNVYGEPYFRRLETETVKELVSARERCVISVGGGLPMQEANQSCLKELGTVIYLRATVETLMGRLQSDTSRPMLRGGDLRTRIETLMAARQETYERVADICIDTDGKTFSQLILEITEKIS